MIGHGFESGRGFHGGFHVVINLPRAAHGFAAYGHARVVHLRGQLRDAGVQVGQDGEEVHVGVELAGVEGAGQDVGIVLRGGERVLHKRKTVRPGFGQGFALVGREADQKGEPLPDVGHGGLDVRRIRSVDYRRDVLIRHNYFLSWVGGFGFWFCGAAGKFDQFVSLLGTDLFTLFFEITKHLTT